MEEKIVTGERAVLERGGRDEGRKRVIGRVVGERREGVVEEEEGRLWRRGRWLLWVKGRGEVAEGCSGAGRERLEGCG